MGNKLILTESELAVWLKTKSDIDTIKFIRERRNIGYKEAFDILNQHKKEGMED